MKICNHAIRRYKQRLGGRTASKKRIVRKIHREIETNTIRKYMRNNHLFIETTNFTAVCYKGTIITILLPEDKYEPRSDEDDLLQMYSRDASSVQ